MKEKEVFEVLQKLDLAENEEREKILMNCNIDELSMLQNNAETNKKLKLENQKQVLTAILDALSIYHLLLSKDKYKESRNDISLKDYQEIIFTCTNEEFLNLIMLGKEYFRKKVTSMNKVDLNFYLYRLSQCGELFDIASKYCGDNLKENLFIFS